MKASRLLFLSPTLLLFGGCIFDPLPPDYTNYPSSYNGGVQRPYPGPRYGTQPGNPRISPESVQPGIDQFGPTEPRRPEPIPRQPENRIAPPPTDLPEPDINLTRPAQPEAKMGIPVPGREDLIYSPWVEKERGMMDVKGIASGVKVICEWTGKHIIVP